MTKSTMESPQIKAPPRVVAVSGVIFSLLYMVSLILIRLSVPADPTESGEWMLDSTYRNWFGISLNLVPFSGIAFLWFMAVLRNRIGLLEDRFFGTVFLGSGLLFVSMLFAAAAVSQGIHVFGNTVQTPAQSEIYQVLRRISYALLNIFGMKMAAVFMFMTSTIGLRTGVIARWVTYVGYTFGLILLLVITDFAWIALLFPSWVLILSMWILVADFRRKRFQMEGTGGGTDS